MSSNSTVATLWNGHGLFACRSSNSSEECCGHIEALLSRVCESGSWCFENFAASLCRSRIAHVPLPFEEKYQWHALFLSLNEQHTKDHDISEWRQYTGGSWNQGLRVSPFPSRENSLNVPLFSASLKSSLSETGGMHRLLHHSITVTCPPTTDTYKASLTMLLFVSEHVFIDVDDPFDSGNDVSFISKNQIDIEQPAFASPQHVVAVQIHVDERECDYSPAPIEFATKLHVRYPPLTSRGFLDIALPAPFLYQAWLMDSFNNKNYTLRQSSWQPPIETRVATGYDGDYTWVVTITILWSLVGSLMLLRSLSKVSKWN